MRGAAHDLRLAAARAQLEAARRSSGSPSCVARDRRAPGRAGPGPEHSRRGSSSAAPLAIVSSPCVGSSARTSTASADPSSLADEVQAPVDPVGAVDVRVPGRAEHRRGCAASARGSRGSPGPRRRRPRPRRSAAHAVHEERAADERRRDLVHAAGEEVATGATAQKSWSESPARAVDSSRWRARRPRSARSTRPVLRVGDDPLGERDRLVHQRVPAGVGLALSARIARSVREAMIGSGCPRSRRACAGRRRGRRRVSGSSA